MNPYRRLTRAAMLVCALATGIPAANAADGNAVAKQLFGHAKLPAAIASEPHGFYSKGCIAGAVAIPVELLVNRRSF